MFYKKVVFKNIAIFIVTAIFNLLLNRGQSYVNKYFDSESYWFYIDIEKIYFSVQFTNI